MPCTIVYDVSGNI